MNTLTHSRQTFKEWLETCSCVGQRMHANRDCCGCYGGHAVNQFKFNRQIHQQIIVNGPQDIADMQIVKLDQPKGRNFIYCVDKNLQYVTLFLDGGCAISQSDRNLYQYKWDAGRFDQIDVIGRQKHEKNDFGDLSYEIDLFGVTKDGFDSSNEDSGRLTYYSLCTMVEYQNRGRFRYDIHTFTYSPESTLSEAYSVGTAVGVTADGSIAVFAGGSANQSSWKTCTINESIIHDDTSVTPDDTSVKRNFTVAIDFDVLQSGELNGLSTAPDGCNYAKMVPTNTEKTEFFLIAGSGRKRGLKLWKLKVNTNEDDIENYGTVTNEEIDLTKLQGWEKIVRRKYIVKSAQLGRNKQNIILEIGLTSATARGTQIAQIDLEKGILCMLCGAKGARINIQKLVIDRLTEREIRAQWYVIRRSSYIHKRRIFDCIHGCEWSIIRLLHLGQQKNDKEECLLAKLDDPLLARVISFLNLIKYQVHLPLLGKY